jgi:hypothetical protein
LGSWTMLEAHGVLVEFFDIDLVGMQDVLGCGLALKFSLGRSAITVLGEVIEPVKRSLVLDHELSVVILSDLGKDSIESLNVRDDRRSLPNPLYSPHPLVHLINHSLLEERPQDDVLFLGSKAKTGSSFDLEGVLAVLEELCKLLSSKQPL